MVATGREAPREVGGLVYERNGGVRADESGGAETAGMQCVEGPCVFEGELIDHGPGLQILRQDLPSVGFHFEVGSGVGMGTEPIESSEHVIGRGRKKARGLMVKRNVEVDAPFQLSHGFGAVRFGERMGQVEPSAQGAVGGTLDDLMHVGVIREGLKCLADIRGGLDPEGIGKVDFTDANSMLPESFEGFVGRFEFNREMAAVVVDAEMFLEPQVAGAIGAQAVEERDGFGGGFEGAQRFGFEVEVE